MAEPRNLRLERTLFTVADGQPVAPPDPEPVSSGLGSRQRQPQHLGFLRQTRPLLLLPELLRKQRRQKNNGRFLGLRVPDRPGSQSVPRRLPATGSGFRNR